MVILTLNCGSSSAKYQVYDWEHREVLAVGIVERVTQGNSFIKHKVSGREELTIQQDCPDHTSAVELIIRTLTDPDHGVIADMGIIKAVGHRVLHGAMKFTKSVVVNEEVLSVFQEIVGLGPLHLPANIAGVRAAQKVLPDVPHCAVMDTAWHQTMPPECFMYATPYEWFTKHQVRRYGFHGTSFLYTAKRAAVLLGKDPFRTNLIIAHIGNGASINAVKNGCSFDTSMGLTPLEGLIMGTRSGDMDPAIIHFISGKTGLGTAEIDRILNKQSGILGITEKWTDRRDVLQAAERGDERARLAQAMEGYRIKKYIGAYLAALGRAGALVFTAGVGEMSPVIRGLATAGLEELGIVVDPERNAACRTRNAETEISAPGSKVRVFIIPTDEELVMTEDAYALMAGTYGVPTKFRYSFQDPGYRNREREAGLERDLAKNPALAACVARPPA
jgi:acetate kinase